jgi:hypothetical protein
LPLGGRLVPELLRCIQRGDHRALHAPLDERLGDEGLEQVKSYKPKAYSPLTLGERIRPGHGMGALAIQRGAGRYVASRAKPMKAHSDDLMV